MTARVLAATATLLAYSCGQIEEVRPDYVYAGASDPDGPCGLQETIDSRTGDTVVAVCYRPCGSGKVDPPIVWAADAREGSDMSWTARRNCL